jgi:hypothetical protein
LLSACWRTAPRFNMRAIDGGEGLSLEIPEDFQAIRNDDRLRVFSPKRERSRSPVDITITTSSDKPRLPGAKIRRVGGRSIAYEVDDQQGGSGGPSVRLRAWVESGDRLIVLDSIAQPDSGGDGQFNAEWAILPTLRWAPPK